MFMFTSTHKRIVKNLRKELIDAFNEHVDYILKIERLERQLYKAQYDIASLLRERLHNKKPRIVTPFSKEELTTLIKFCHPDKNGGNAEATKITSRLLELRSRV